MEYYKYVGEKNTDGLSLFSASVWLNLLTETEMCAFFRSSTQIIADTALLMSNRDWVVDVASTRFDDVMTACVAENIFTNDRVNQFKRGVEKINESEYVLGVIQ
tara:strand:+ start:359 stop:670 length:312 start_codon:yes stop_codon:yes gene_type:complete